MNIFETQNLGICICVYNVSQLRESDFESCAGLGSISYFQFKFTAIAFIQLQFFFFKSINSILYYFFKFLFRL